MIFGSYAAENIYEKMDINGDRGGYRWACDNCITDILYLNKIITVTNEYGKIIDFSNNIDKKRQKYDINKLIKENHLLKQQLSIRTNKKKYYKQITNFKFDIIDANDKLFLKKLIYYQNKLNNSIKW